MAQGGKKTSNGVALHRILVTIKSKTEKNSAYLFKTFHNHNLFAIFWVCESNIFFKCITSNMSMFPNASFPSPDLFLVISNKFKGRIIFYFPSISVMTWNILYLVKTFIAFLLYIRKYVMNRTEMVRLHGAHTSEEYYSTLY